MSAVKSRREALGITQIALARKAFVSPSLIRMIEQGYEPKRGESLARVHKTLTDLEQEQAA